MVQPGVTAPIASATSEKHPTDLVEATRLTLDRESIEKLNAASEQKTAA
jgi:aryl-alcohol dehydrogenase-like predicted oxidoreductase